MPDWWSSVLLPVVSKYPVGYVLTWRDTFRPKVSGMEKSVQSFPDDFKYFYNSPRTLFLKEVIEANVYLRNDTKIPR